MCAAGKGGSNVEFQQSATAAHLDFGTVFFGLFSEGRRFKDIGAMKNTLIRGKTE